MGPEFLFHGTGIAIKGKYLLPKTPSDKSYTENYQNAVYATDRKDIAIGMALTTEKYTTTFGDYRKKPFKVIFLRGEPKKQYVYVYKIKSKNFIKQANIPHQWVSKVPVKIISKERYLVKNLNAYWHKADQWKK